jgi:hypothetical protein
MFVGLRRAATAKKQRRTVRPKSAAKSENKNYDHFTPISGQASARLLIKFDEMWPVTLMELKIDQWGGWDLDSPQTGDITKHPLFF